MKRIRERNKITVLCKHCREPIDKARLIGFSLICPLCKRPQNGHPHLKI